MINITFKGTPVSISGDIIKVGQEAPNFTLTSASLEKVTLLDLQKKFPNTRKILNIVPSFDTSTCAASAKQFDAFTAPNTSVIGISRDTPFAQNRFCEMTKITNSCTLSDVDHSFGKLYNLEMTSGPLQHFLARAVIVLDENNKVILAQVVPEITQEPNYDEVLKVLS